MKPRSKIEQEVMRLSTRLPEPTEAQLTWAKRTLFEHHFYVTLSTRAAWCSMCGAVSLWEAGVLATQLGVATQQCECCGAVLDGQVSRKRVYHREAAYFTIATTIDAWQVFRHILVTRYGGRGSVRYSVGEAVQHWIDEEGHCVCVARPTLACSFYYDLWQFSKPMSVKYRSGLYDKYTIAAPIAPRARIAKWALRRGFNIHYKTLAPDLQLRALLFNPMLERLMKAKQYELFRRLYEFPAQQKEYEPAVRICLRNHYHVEDASLWCDYVDMLIAEGKDIRNRYYVCPDDLTAAHAVMLRRSNRREEERLRRDKEAALRDKTSANKAYIERVKRFIGVRLDYNGMHAEILPDVESFFVEGAVMHHCVFANRYYEKKNALIFSVRGAEGERLATVELSAKTGNVLQCRAKYNGVPHRQAEILTMFDLSKNIILRC